MQTNTHEEFGGYFYRHIKLHTILGELKGSGCWQIMLALLHELDIVLDTCSTKFVLVAASHGYILGPIQTNTHCLIMLCRSHAYLNLVLILLETNILMVYGYVWLREETPKRHVF